jgi:ATP-dependent protease ClpP protease subunit
MFKHEPIWGKKQRQGKHNAIRANNNSSPMTVEVIDNHIYYYADVDSDRGLALMRAVREKDRDLRAEQLSRGLEGAEMTPIWLHLYSYGGDLFIGFSLADQLAGIKSPIYAVIEGICASAATLIALSASKRYILPSSYMLIHQFSSFIWGTHEQFKDEMALQEMVMQRLVVFYTARTKASEAQIRQMLTRDSWLDAETCLQLGFADELLR